MSENPHILTPEAAKEKWCPLSMANSSVRYKCQADACMAWRWTQKFTYDERQAKHLYYSETHGSCGVVEP